MSNKILFISTLIFFQFKVLAQTFSPGLIIPPDSSSAPLVNHEWDHFAFDSCLIQIRDNALITKLRQEQDSALTDFALNKIKKNIDFNDQWKLAYYVHYGWEEDYKRKHEDIYDIYKAKNTEKYFTTKEIFAAVEITDSIFKSSPGYEEMRHSVNNYLLFPDSYRGFWTPIITLRGNLIVFYGHYYPNGNTHSWLRLYFYYFEKVNNKKDKQ